jgi:hypothetical protein
VVPKFIIDEAVERCEVTLKAAVDAEGVDTRKEKMLAAFKKLADWITEVEIATACGKTWESIDASDVVKMLNLYNAIKDGFVRPEAAFGKEEAQKASPVSDAEKSTLSSLNEELGNGINAK